MKKNKLTYTDNGEKITISGTLVPFADTKDLYRFYTKHELPPYITDFVTDSGMKLEKRDITDYGRVHVVKLSEGESENE